MRSELVEHVVTTLKRQGFIVSTFFEFKSCFDVAAKNKERFFVIKVLENADALREENASELKRIASIFRAIPILIAEKTKARELETGTAYERYGIPLVSFPTFSQLLRHDDLHSQSFKGKELVQLNPHELRERRNAAGWTLSELGHKIGVSAQTLHRYEKGRKALQKHAARIEKRLGKGIIEHSKLFSVPVQSVSFDSRFSDHALEKIHSLGMELALFEHAPFKALGKPGEPFLINLGKEKKELKRKALVLEKTKTVFKGHSVVISKEYKIKRIAHTPVFAEEELESYTKIQQLLEEIKKREKQASKKR